jgi:hypothetical protein
MSGGLVCHHTGSSTLLQFYVLELHHLAPSGVLHIAAFLTLCEAYMGIEPHFALWNHFFHSRLLQGSDEEAAVLGYDTPI